MKHCSRSLLVVCLLIACFVGGCSDSRQVAPVARGGVLDLSQWSPAQDGPVALNGEWEFYWDRLLAPDDFAAGEGAPRRTGFLSFPGFWKGYELGGAALPGTGLATFRLRIVPAPGARQLTLRLFSIPAAYKAWANGELVASSGVIGRSAEAETSVRSLVLATVATNGAPVDLVMQISNHYFFRGGVQNPIMLAEPGTLEQAHMITRSWNLLFVGCMLIMALYHFILYLLRNKDNSTLFFGLYCLVLTVLTSTNDSSDWLVLQYFPDLEFVTISTIVLICYGVSTSILYRFYRSLFPREFGRLLLWIVDIRGLVFIAIVLTQPGFVVHTALQVFALSALCFTMLFLTLLIVCFRRGYRGSLILLCGFIMLALTSAHDVYFIVFSTNAVGLLPLGMFALVLSQALALAQRFSKSFRDVEQLSEKLEAKNVSLEQEIAERIRLEREVVNISEEERRRMSLDLHDGLCQQLTGARLRCAALTQLPQEPGGKQEELGKLSALLDEMVDQAYDLSCGIWPLEHGAGSAGPSMADMVRRHSRSSGIPMEFQDERPCDSCQNAQVTQLYRIAQEAIANAVKHARPGRVTVSLCCTDSCLVTMTVRDDGIGRSAAVQSKGGLGMSIMRHRAMMIGGDLKVVDIDEEEGGGTKVVCSVACHSCTQNQRVK